MTKEELQKRIEKKEQDIAKIEKRISKWAKGLRPQDIEAVKPFGDCYYGDKPRDIHWSNFHGTETFQQAYANYKDYIGSHTDIPESDDWNKGPNIGELYNAYRDLGESRHTLEKYQTELSKLANYENEEKVPAIWEFLMRWKEASRDWYHRNAERYFNLKKEYNDKRKEWLDSIGGKPSAYEERRFISDYYENVDSFTKEITNLKGRYSKADIIWDSTWVIESYTVDEELLEKQLDKEVRAKYSRLIQDVTHITGEITDATGLWIDGKGQISGIVKGVKGTAYVNTFMAGINWIVQRPHYRTRIDPIK